MVGKGGTAGFLGKAFDPYTLYPDGDDMDMNKMDRIRIDDLQLRPEVFASRLERLPGWEAAKPHDPVAVGFLDAIHEEKRLTVRDQCLRVFHGGTLPCCRGSREAGVLEIARGEGVLSILTSLVGVARGQVMELKELYQLMDRFEKSGLSELTWRREKDLVRLRKGPPPGHHDFERSGSWGELGGDPGCGHPGEAHRPR